MNRTEKKEFVTAFTKTAQEASLFVVTRQTGLSVLESEKLRRSVREEGGHFRVAKNTLLKLAFKDTPVACLTEMLQGPTAIAYSNDPIAAARGVMNFAKGNDKIEIIAGCLDGASLDVAGVKALAALPSLDVLRGQILGVITAPLQKVMGMAHAPATSLARVLSQRAKQL